MTLRTAAVVAALFSVLPATSLAAEFTGSATYHWAFQTLSSIEVEQLGSYVTGTTEGVVTSDDAAWGRPSAHCIATGDLDNVVTGLCILIEPAGDRWSQTFTCDPVAEGDVPAGALGACAGTATVVPGSGTGKYAKISGSATFDQAILGSMPGGVLTGTSTFKFDLTY